VKYGITQTKDEADLRNEVIGLIVSGNELGASPEVTADTIMDLMKEFGADFSGEQLRIEYPVSGRKVH
jgi:hypothetical protein